MSNNWKFSQLSENSLRNFLITVEHHKVNCQQNNQSRNDWLITFSKKSVKRKHNSPTTDSKNEDILIIEDETAPNCVKRPKQSCVEIDTNPNTLLEFDGNVDTFFETMEKLQSNDLNEDALNGYVGLLRRMVNASPETFLRICTVVCDAKIISQIFIQNFCTEYLVPYLKNSLPSRYLDNGIVMFFFKYPLEICKYVFVPLMCCVNPIPLLPAVIAKLTIEQKLIVLKTYLQSRNDHSVGGEWVLSTFNVLLKCVSNYDVAIGFQLLNFLKSNAKEYVNSQSFGKILLASTQYLLKDRVQNKLYESALVEIVSGHKSPFRNACLLLLESKKAKL